jgi:hypothetical protein
MKRIEAIESAALVTSIGTFDLARQIQMGEFNYLSGGLQTFFIIAIFSAAIAGASELVRRRDRNSKNNS